MSDTIKKKRKWLTSLSIVTTLAAISFGTSEAQAVNVAACIQSCSAVHGANVLSCDLDNADNTYCASCGGSLSAYGVCQVPMSGPGIGISINTIHACLDAFYAMCLTEAQKDFRTCARNCRGLPPFPTDTGPNPPLVVPDPGGAVIVFPPKQFFPIFQ